LTKPSCCEFRKHSIWKMLILGRRVRVHNKRATLLRRKTSHLSAPGRVSAKRFATSWRNRPWAHARAKSRRCGGA